MEDVRKVARLARLAVLEEQAQQYRGQLAAVLGYMERLREVDISGVEPMSHPTPLHDQTNRLDEDDPALGAALASGALAGMAPAMMDAFVKVPKVIGESGGA